MEKERSGKPTIHYYLTLLGTGVLLFHYTHTLQRNYVKHRPCGSDHPFHGFPPLVLTPSCLSLYLSLSLQILISSSSTSFSLLSLHFSLLLSIFLPCLFSIPPRFSLLSLSLFKFSHHFSFYFSPLVYLSFFLPPLLSLVVIYYPIFLSLPPFLNFFSLCLSFSSIFPFSILLSISLSCLLSTSPHFSFSTFCYFFLSLSLSNFLTISLSIFPSLSFHRSRAPSFFGIPS